MAPSPNAETNGNGRLCSKTESRYTPPAQKAERQTRVRVDTMKTSPEQIHLYGAVDPAGEDIAILADSIKRVGLKQPLVVTKDNYILSGHRRHAALAKLGQGMAPTIRVAWKRVGNLQRFADELRTYNLQRKKTVDQEWRESLFDDDSDIDHVAFDWQERVDGDGGATSYKPPIIRRKRDRIGSRKMPMLRAVKKILADYVEFLPVTVRKIHYALLNYPPLKDANNGKSTYQNDKVSYSNLVKLLTRARIDKLIPWTSITDETRSITRWRHWDSVGAFFGQQLEDFLDGYAQRATESA